MNAWKPKRTFIDIAKDVAQFLLVCIMFAATFLMMFALA